jgi:nitroreductase
LTILDAIFSRRSIRSYQPRPVESELLVQLLQAAMAAPTACNSQPWEFVVVTEPEKVAALRQKLYAGKYNAPRRDRRVRQ